MKIEIKELNDDLESTENTHIVYVKSETNQSIEAELCNETFILQNIRTSMTLQR